MNIRYQLLPYMYTLLYVYVGAFLSSPTVRTLEFQVMYLEQGKTLSSRDMCADSENSIATSLTTLVQP